MLEELYLCPALEHKSKVGVLTPNRFGNYSQCWANNTSPVRITGMIALLDSPNKHKLQATQHTSLQSISHLLIVAGHLRIRRLDFQGLKQKDNGSMQVGNT